jgi:hypothetical protein
MVLWLASSILANGPVPIAVNTPTVALVATHDEGSASLTWRRISGNTAGNVVTLAEIPCEHRRIRLVGTWTDRSTWSAALGTSGFKRGNVIVRTDAAPLRVEFSVKFAATERSASVKWMQCDDTDFNGDGKTDGTDLAEALARWGKNDPLCDVDRNGTVDGADLAAVLSAWST